MRVAICQSAEKHEDGTYSIVRGGLSGFLTPVPLNLEAAIFIEIDRDEVPPGDHSFRMTASGVLTIDASQPITVRSGAGEGRFVFPLRQRIERYGTLRIDVHIGPARGFVELEFSPRPTVSA